jgi:hypothetical protein
MTRLRSAGRLALAAVLHGIVWLIELGTTPVDDDTPPGNRHGGMWRADHRQDLDD